mgnify:CR=1 FL=1
MKVNKGDWISNQPKTIKSYWPRRSVKIVEGEPKLLTEWVKDYNVDNPLVGIYLDEDLDKPLKEYPLCKNFKEYTLAMSQRFDN